MPRASVSAEAIHPEISLNYREFFPLSRDLILALMAQHGSYDPELPQA